MGDEGAIGSIIEDMIVIIHEMEAKGSISFEDLRLSMHLLYFLNIDCRKEHIDLCIGEKYIKMMTEFISEDKLEKCEDYVNE